MVYSRERKMRFLGTKNSLWFKEPRVAGVKEARGEMELTTLGSMHLGECLLYSTGWPNLTGYCSCCSMDRLGLRE